MTTLDAPPPLPPGLAVELTILLIVSTIKTIQVVTDLLCDYFQF